MLLDLLRAGEFDFIDLMVGLFSSIFVVFCTMPIHEYAHALIATKLGDQTPRLAGRLTLNPMAHISPIGAMMIILVGFGYAKPVSVNPRNFKNDKVGMALTALAGPISNLLMGFIMMFLAVTTIYFGRNASNFQLIQAIVMFFQFACIININLAVFNLLPIPPLDGSRILELLIPKKYYYQFMQYERYVVMLVFVLIATGVLSKPLSILTNIVYDLFFKIAVLPFGL